MSPRPKGVLRLVSLTKLKSVSERVRESTPEGLIGQMKSSG